MSDTAPQMGPMEQWLTDNTADLHPDCVTQSDAIAFARERDAAYASLERQRDALLAVLRPFVQKFDDGTGHGLRDIEQARAAIAAAEGVTA